MDDAKKSEAARILGSVKTPKKAASSRANGKKGGRPMTKHGIIERLNAGADPKDFNLERLSDDGRNSYWVRPHGGVAIMRLNCFEDDDGSKYWDDDVSGWEL